MLRIYDPQNIACILYQSMLKAPSGTQKRHPLRPRVGDRI